MNIPEYSVSFEVYDENSSGVPIVYNSITDFGIIFSSFTLGSPGVRQMIIDVPYRDGQLDYTEYFGETKFTDRGMEIGFIIPYGSNHNTIYSNVLDKLHGKKFKIYHASDSDWYYLGRVGVNALTPPPDFWNFNLTVDAYPYKLKDTTHTYTYATAGTQDEITIVNSRMTTIPTITTNNPISIIFGNTSIALSAGTHKNSSFYFKEGSNTFKFFTNTANTVIALNYREGRL